MALTKRHKEWLSSLGLSLRVIAATLEGHESAAYKAEDAPKNLREIAEALERAGMGQL